VAQAEDSPSNSGPVYVTGRSTRSRRSEYYRSETIEDRAELVSAARGVGTSSRPLSISGTDPTTGAGMQADVNSIAAAGAYGMAVVTSRAAAQNTAGVRDDSRPLRLVEDSTGAPEP